jgi:monoamine oxidase
MSRTILIRHVRRWLAPPISRRTFLRLSAASTPAVVFPQQQTPRVAIVGAGVAGLYAAWLLKRSGVRADVYESSKRAGGRMFSATDLLAPGITTELGGEFIDTGHREILGLARHFSLPLIDTQSGEERKLRREAYLFGGSLRSEEEISAQFRELAPRLSRDINAARRFDRMSIAQYLDTIGAQGWIRSLMEVAFLTEYGLEIDRQSAMNLLSLVSPENLRLFGESDERYKILGGNQRIVDALAESLPGQIQYEHRLDAITVRNGVYVLNFGSRELTAPVVLLALPFSILRRIRIGVPLPPLKRRAIYELPYGTDAKLMFGVRSRVWRSHGYGGNLFSDEPFQLAWDGSRGQQGEPGGVTMLCGGRRGIELARTGAEGEVRTLLPVMEKAWSGLAEAYNGRSARFHWPSHTHTLGCYSCYAPGQWTTIRGHEFPAIGRLHFAGEHTSLNFQGFMEGGAETGKRAARAIARQCGIVPAF